MHMQNVESMWQKVRSKAKCRFDDSRNLLTPIILSTCGASNLVILTMSFILLSQIEIYYIHINIFKDMISRFSIVFACIAAMVLKVNLF